VEPVIKVHRLHRFLVSPQIPSQFLSLSDCQTGTENPDYTNLEAQDQLLLSWLQSSLSASFLTHIIGCKHSFQVWEKIHTHFTSQTKAKARQLQTKLRTLKKGDLSINDFMLWIKAFIDSLASTNELISDNEYLEVLIEGRSTEYDSFLSLIHSKSNLFSIDEIASLLVAQEARLEKFKRDGDTISLHLTHANSKIVVAPTVHLTHAIWVLAKFFTSFLSPRSLFFTWSSRWLFWTRTGSVSGLQQICSYCYSLLPPLWP